MLFYKKYLEEIHSQLLLSKWDDNDKKKEVILSVCNLIEASQLDSEYKIISELKRSKLFFDIEYHNIQDEINECMDVDNSVILTKINYTVGIFPLKIFFGVLFNSTPFLRDIILYYQILLAEQNNGTIKNYVQSNHWKKIISKYPASNEIFYLPLFIFSDDFEPNNALGSHAGIQKICGVYLKFACLPDHMASKLQNIYTGMLLFSEDRKQFGNSRVFTPFINCLNTLESEGIFLDSEIEGYKVVKLVPVLVLGDNLGLNTILGFSESFQSNFFCRFCKMKRYDTQKYCEENLSLLRNYINYEGDVGASNFKQTGIKETCVWNKLKHFNVLNNFSVDVMHDLLEGVCHYDLIFILNSFITKYNFFTLEQLNYRILVFNYGPNCKNKPPILNSDALLKLKLKLSASEMKTFSFNLTLIIGDLVPDCEEWTLYLLLREILSICCSSDVLQIESNVLLQNLITEHHNLYLKLSNSTLKPKYHNMTHYGRIMNEVGPLKHLSSIRFEAFHQPFKKCATSTSSRVNLIKTLFTKYQLNIANTLINFEEFYSKKIKVGRIVECDKERIVKKFKLQIPISITNHLIINDILYKNKMVVHIGYSEDQLPEFALILHICNQPQPIFCLQEILNHGFDTHYFAFRVELNDFFLNFQWIHCRQKTHHTYI